MTLWDYLDRRHSRRAAMPQAIMKAKDWPRAVISTAIVALFTYAYWSNPDDEMMKGALIAAFTTVVTWWLGSSKGSADKSDQIERMDEGIQDVSVKNTAVDPVPTTDEPKDD